MSRQLRVLATETLRCAAYAAAILAGAYATVRLTATADDVRALLGLTLRPQSRSVAEALTIAANNLRLLAAPLAAALVVNARPQLRLALDLLLATLLITNAALIGAALAAYGNNLAQLLLAHGPIELAGFALGYGAYRTARRQALTRPQWAIATLGGSVALLVAAGLEGLTPTH